MNSQDEEVVKHIETIDQLVTHQIEILPKIAIPDFKINFISENADLAKVDKFLNTMYQYAFKSNNQEEIDKLLQDSFQIEN